MFVLKENTSKMYIEVVNITKIFAANYQVKLINFNEMKYDFLKTKNFFHFSKITPAPIINTPTT